MSNPLDNTQLFIDSVSFIIYGLNNTPNFSC